MPWFVLRCVVLVITLLGFCRGAFCLAQSNMVPPGERVPVTQVTEDDTFGAQNDNPLDRLPVSRAAFSQLLVGVLGYNSRFVSDFATFRDVPLSQPQYAAIETLREQNALEGLAGNFAGGYFHPEKPVTRAEAWSVLAFHHLKGYEKERLPTLEESATLLGPWPQTLGLPVASRQSLARLVQAGVIRPGGVPVQAEAEIPRQELVALLESVAMHQRSIGHYHESFTLEKQDRPLLPPGLLVKASPTAAIFKDRLAVGDTVYFYITEPLPVSEGFVLPGGSRLKAVASDLHAETGQLEVHIEELTTPDGYGNYRLFGQLTLSFGEKDTPFLTPGQIFTFTTLTPEQASGNARKN